MKLNFTLAKPPTGCYSLGFLFNVSMPKAVIFSIDLFVVSIGIVIDWHV
jgi:hypothetical protein